MEKTSKITVEDVIAFIKKAMKENLKIEFFFCGLGIEITEGNNTIKINPVLSFTPNKYECIYIQGKNGSVKVPIQNETDILKYKIVYNEVKEYIENKGVEDFYNFFNEDNSKLKNADDLDDDED